MSIDERDAPYCAYGVHRLHRVRHVREGCDVVVAGRTGFSLLEIMAVVVIMGLLVGAVAVSVRGYIGTAKIKRVDQDLIGLDHQIQTFWMATGRYPTTEEGLDVLIKEVPGYIPSIKVIAFDPWSNPYEYVLLSDLGEVGEEPYLITCFGSDRQKGGSGSAADITHIEARDRAAKGK